MKIQAYVAEVNSEWNRSKSFIACSVACYVCVMFAQFFTLFPLHCASSGNAFDALALVLVYRPLDIESSTRRNGVM